MHLDAVRPVFDRSGPYLTVHAEVGRTDEHALDRIDARWTSLRHELERQEIDPAVAEDVGARLRENLHVAGEARRTIVATASEVVFDEVQAGHAAWPETVDIDDLPDLAGWLRHASRAVPFLLAQVDRTCGDITFYRAVNRTATDSTTVEGTSFQITKVPQGDWAQKQYENRAEELWAHNAADVVDALTTMVRRHRPRMILVGGDVRAVDAVTDALSGQHIPVVRLDSGGRAPGRSDDALWAEVRRILAEHEAHADQDVADRLVEGAARRRGVAIGSTDVLEALVRRQVDELVLDLDQAGTTTIHPADFPGLELPDPARHATEVPADRALVAAAARSDAELTLLPGELMPDHGVAAMLRWAG